MPRSGNTYTLPDGNPLVLGTVDPNTIYNNTVADIATELTNSMSTSFSAPVTNSLAAQVALNNTALYFDGPSVNVGTVGKWFVSGNIVFDDTVPANFDIKLWDGTTLINSATLLMAASAYTQCSLSGVAINPSGNLKISIRDITTVNGRLLPSAGYSNKNCTITAFRIG